MYLLHDHDPENAAKVYRLSRNGRQEFPLAVVSLNVTKWTLQVSMLGKEAWYKERHEEGTPGLEVLSSPRSEL